MEHQIHVALQLKGISSNSVHLLRGSLAGIFSLTATTSTVSTVTLTSTSMSSTTSSLTTTSATVTASSETQLELGQKGGLVGSFCSEDLETCEASLLVAMCVSSCLLGAIGTALLCSCRRSPQPLTAQPVQDLPVILERSLSRKLAKQIPDGEAKVDSRGLELDLEGCQPGSDGFPPTLEDIEADSGKTEAAITEVANAIDRWVENDESLVVSRV